MSSYLKILILTRFPEMLFIIINILFMTVADIMVAAVRYDVAPKYLRTHNSNRFLG